MTFFYKILLSIYEKASKQNRKAIRLVLELIRRLFIWLGDPSYIAEIRGKRISLPISHKLPIYILDFPLYDTLPVRVTNYLRKRDGALIMVDVGANVGDTLLACNINAPEDMFLGVEANPEFVPYLKKNMDNTKKFLIIEAYCHSGDEEQVYVYIESTGGTARLLETQNGVLVSKKTLDSILIENPEYKRFNFLKLDTDGNDFDILKGAQKSIGDSLPIIFMECDVFGNVNYVDNALEAIDSLKRLGYSTVIVYDNFGNYFCTFDVSASTLFMDALAYQIISEFGYFDLLFLSAKDKAFFQSEREFFLRNIKQKGLSVPLQKAFINENHQGT